MSSSRSLRSITRPSVSSFGDLDDYVDLRPMPQQHPPMAENTSHHRSSHNSGMGMGHTSKSSQRDTSYTPFDNSILTIPLKRDMSGIKVLVVGGGIAGLAMAVMMSKTENMEYEVLERSTGLEPPMGGSLILGPSVLRLLEQLDLLDDIFMHSKKSHSVTLIDEQVNKLGRVGCPERSRYGYDFRTITRSDLHRILMDRIPRERLHMGKLVTETLQNAGGASCRCSDGSTFHGDIIVGADGSTSEVREKMFAHLKEQGRMHESDLEPSKHEFFYMTGVTNELSAEEYRAVAADEAKIYAQYKKDKPFSVWLVPVPKQRVAFVIHLRGTAEQLHGRPNGDWMIPNANYEHLQELLDFQAPIGNGTLGDLLKNVDPSGVCGVHLENRIFKSWYAGRIVLLGDACHKTAAGQGSVHALLDAVQLVNLLYEMENCSLQEFTKAFKKYQEKRTPVVKSAIEDSYMIDKLFEGKTLFAGVARKLLFNSFINIKMTSDKVNCNRPQLSFIPFVEDRGQSKANKQKISTKIQGYKTFPY